MSELEIIKLVFGILLSAGAVVLFVLTFTLYHKYLVQEKRCTQKIKGTVQRYTLFRYGGERSGTFLPVVFYHVDGKQYKVVGPEYRIYKEMVKTTPWSENNAQFTENDQPLTFKGSLNSVKSTYIHPIRARFSIGSEVDVYYDPQNPKLAYVLRYCNKKWCFWLMFFRRLTCTADRYSDPAHVRPFFKY